MAGKAGLLVRPASVAELGPGDSLGIGLAALLCGTDRYYALDVVKYANRKRDAEIVDELINLFRKRERIPDDTEFPDVKPYLESYEFPHHLLTHERLSAALGEHRVQHIRRALLDPDDGPYGKIRISYVVPWHDSTPTEKESVDMIYSQAVLEHVDDLASTYEELYRWLNPGGFMSHQIDFRSHGVARKWNGHWAYSDPVWRVLRAWWPYLINREPHSRHIELLRRLGLEIVCDVMIRTHAGIHREQLAPRFRSLSDEDLTTSGAFVQAVKKRNAIEHHHM